MLNCYNGLCVYQDDGLCSLRKIELDELGQCTSCIYPNIDDELLKKLKLETLISLGQSYNGILK